MPGIKSQSVRIVGFIAVVCLWIGSLLLPTQAATEEGELLELSVQQIDGRDMIQLKFADVTVAATELKFLHENGATTDVSVADQKVQMKTATSRTVAKSIQVALHQGIQGRNGKKSQSGNR